jgi:hypothetical protein
LTTKFPINIHHLVLHDYCTSFCFFFCLQYFIVLLLDLLLYCNFLVLEMFFLTPLNGLVLQLCRVVIIFLNLHCISLSRLLGPLFFVLLNFRVFLFLFHFLYMSPVPISLLFPFVCSFEKLSLFS